MYQNSNCYPEVNPDPDTNPDQDLNPYITFDSVFLSSFFRTFRFDLLKKFGCSQEIAVRLAYVLKKVTPPHPIYCHLSAFLLN